MPQSTCSIDQCESSVVARGWCNLHWKRWRNHGDPLHLVPKQPKSDCVIDGCDRQLGGGGRDLCSMHYQRWRTTGSTDRLRGAGENRYSTVDLLTGQLTVVQIDETEHVSTYDLADHDLVSRYRWHVNPGGYLAATVGSRQSRSTELLHRLILGLPHGDKRFGDHINGDRLDNRRENLRAVDAKLNAANQAIINESGTSKYRGVCWAKDPGKWKAYVHMDGRLHNLGFYDTEDEAADVVIAYRATHGIETGYLRRHPHTPVKGRAS